MFSGIVEELGTVVENDIAGRGKLELAGRRVLDGVRVGDSIAVNGCCLTVVSAGDGRFAVDVMPETARLTNLGELVAGDRVNLEAAMRLGDRVGGHLVTGHVEAVARVHAIRDDGNARWVTFDVAAAVAAQLVPKGCVAIDGISLTVVDVTRSGLTVSLIPHTLAVTTAGQWAAGSRVNIESDLMARYAANAVSHALAAARNTAEGAA